ELAGPRADLLHPGDDAGDAAGLLQALDTKAIDPDDLAKLIDGRRSRLSYGVLAGLLVRWLESLPWSASTVDALRERPILLDTAGKWTEPRALVARARRGIEIPPPLARREVKVPPGRSGRPLIERLEIEVLDPGNAL